MDCRPAFQFVEASKGRKTAVITQRRDSPWSSSRRWEKQGLPLCLQAYRPSVPLPKRQDLPSRIVPNEVQEQRRRKSNWLQRSMFALASALFLCFDDSLEPRSAADLVCLYRRPAPPPHLEGPLNRLLPDVMAIG